MDVLGDLLGAASLVRLIQCASAVTETTCSDVVPMRQRREVVSIADFGGVGDGRAVNTWAFRKAICRIQRMRMRGGTELHVPAGFWLTGSFNLTSHMTLYLAKGAVIKAIQDTWNRPLVDPLPSYGRGRERPGRRYMSFIQGNGVTDVIITGDKGVIDGQGEVWWNMWRQRSLRFTRPNLVEFMNSRTFSFLMCNVVIKYITVLTPYDSPNTDGIDPDSSSNVCIEDSYIATGDDLVSVKSGWDEYGIAYARPGHDINIRRVKGTSPFSGVSIGSETSGGIENVFVDDFNIHNTGIGIHIKTNVGRGGYVRKVTIANVNMNNVRTGIRIARDVGDHPDDYFDRRAVPTVDRVTFKNVWGVGVQQPGSIQGIKNSPFTRI